LSLLLIINNHTYIILISFFLYYSHLYYTICVGGLLGSHAHSLLKHTGGCWTGHASSLTILGLRQSWSVLQYASDSIIISTTKTIYIKYKNMFPIKKNCMQHEHAEETKEKILKWKNYKIWGDKIK
jgi:hypothetical protein